jgi:hypothetical protein
LGTANYWRGSTVFWQIDASGKIRDGKIMQYQMKTHEQSSIGINCGRVKTNIPPIKWVNKLMQVQDFKLVQCFFGEHLLSLFPNRKVAVVESEKSALIGSAYHPDFVWLACGGADGLGDRKVRALRGRNVILWPDLGKFELWEQKGKRMKRMLPDTCVRTSNLLDRIATEKDRQNGFDIADFLIRQKWEDYGK